MSDIVDYASEHEQEERDRAIANAAVHVLDPGVPGDCELCGEWSGRLILAACAPCRERYHLP